MTATTAPFLIRAPAAPDREAWARLWEDYLWFYDTRLPAAQFDLQFARLLSDDPRGFRGLMAFRGTEALGLAHYVFHPHGWQAGDTCYLQDLWTSASARGQGIGRALIAAVGQAAQAQGAAQVYWLTHAGNAVARALYDKVGRATGFVEYELGSGTTAS